MAESTGLQVTPDALREKLKEIHAIDVQLDAAAGSSASVERTAQERILDSTEEKWAPFVESVTNTLNEAKDEKVIAGTILAIQRSIENLFSDTVKDVVSEVSREVESEQADVDLSDEEITELEADRKEKVGQFKALANILEMFGFEDEIAAVGEPKVRRGSRGKRGPRTLNKFHYRVNETDLAEDADSLSMVAKLCGIGTRELKTFITDQKDDKDFLKNPPDSWDATLPNGVGTVYAEKKEEFIGEDEGSEDETTDAEETEDE